MYKALIIGAGSIGGLIDSPTSKAVASHAHAYKKHPDTQLHAICEPSELNVFAFMERWGEVHRYATIDEIGSDEEYDIVSISSSTKSHFYDLTTLLKRSDSSMILCEKPLVATQEELSSLFTLLMHSDKKILVHFIRRYNSAFINLADRIQKGEFGKSLGFQGVCTKGLLHNGSHMIAVLSHFLGNVTSIKPFRASFCHDDLCGDFGISLERGDGAISVLSHPPYSLFEITFWFETGVIKILDGGDKIEIYSRVPSTYEGYFSLALQESILTNLSNYAYDSVEFLLRKSKETCKNILSEHFHIHKIIFQTLAKVYP
ncbi:Gfo/Idh/MocA family protein [Sulfuricurvum sp.]|uniref:Gfo/Idh/MocA family protein n=1 Tax=Sulfuricurvum sp. TaxID=2025608 RepID=UPI002E360D5A|nr:Gfo/Idh/MocA family oxidoreductase [Sulfuricurvum sp.]HEX5330378.1 Gfo/Idh/MocA family oxidoreductase [Sulfuricurvum sp.]